MLRPFLVAIGSCSLSACAGTLPHPPFAPQSTEALVVVATPPPPGRAELVPAKPSGADAWVEGQWIQRAGRWSWLLGRWVKTPSGARYSPWVVVRAPDGTAYYAPGSWKSADGARIAGPRALAYAVVNDQSVYDPEGNVDDIGRAIREEPLHVTSPEHSSLPRLP